MPLLMWTTGADGATDWHNQRWFAYTGQPEDAPSDIGWQTLHPDDLQPSRTSWNAAVTSGRMFEIEHRIRRADGACRDPG